MPEAAALTGESADPLAPRLELVGGGASAAAGPPAPRLEVPPYDFAAALRLERELGVSHVVSQLLARRGLAEPELARAFLDARESHEPTAFAGIERACELILRHVRSRSRIFIHGDYDVDGVCATAIMVRALRALGADPAWFIPDRIADGYGLSSATVSRLAARGARLLITVDCGITACEEVAAASQAGLDVVVSDHHTPRADGGLPDCPIVHPALCGYPCPDLCGSGVAFKLAQALGAPTAADELELVALATVADLMPLRGENRRLVREGIAALSNTARPGLRALMRVARLDPSAIDAHALGFRLAPRINASGRIRRADAGLELLLTDDRERAGQIAAELDALNAERRAVEQRIAWEAESMLDAAEPRAANVLWSRGWHPGVIGIVASRLVERTYRPTILVAVDEDGIGHGSGRGIPGFDLLGSLDACARHLERYGGHRAAAGLTIDGARLEGFRAAFELHAAEKLTPELLAPVERVDAIVSGAELGLALAEELASLEPCGIGNPSPKLLVPGARFDDLRAMGDGRHARFSISSGGARARAVAFGCDGRLEVEPGTPADATFRLERNVWKGVVEPRLVLRHARACAPEPIQVVGEPRDYLEHVMSELCRPLTALRADVRAERALIDRRECSPVGVLRDAVAAGEPVLALAADVPRRLAGLRERVGGFAFCSHHALELDPRLGDRFVHIVVLDPPTSAHAAALSRRGAGYTHWCWGAAELRFAWQMHELEYGLRASLAALYRGLRHRGRVTGEELGHLLRGEGTHGRPARLAVRLIRVLVELELVSLDRDLPALAVAGEQRTALERSPAFRAYAARYEDGRRYLSNANLARSA